MKILSRTGLGVALLLMVLFLFYAALLDARATGAQMGGGTTTGTTGNDATSIAPGPDEVCPGAVVVNTTTGTGNKQSPIFNIEGDSFRITTALVATSQDPDLAGVTVNVLTEDDEFVANFDKEGPGTESSIINAGPGQFFSDLNTANADYTVVVEDCIGGDQNGDTDEDTDGVIDDTIPKKPLPDTGGSTALMVGGSALLLLYGSLVAWRLKTRER